MNSSKELVLRFYRSMAEIRQFELIAREIYRSGRMPGFIHIYVGEEAVGMVSSRPWARTTLEIRQMMFLNSSADHRIADGVMADPFLEKITEVIENLD